MNCKPGDIAKVVKVINHRSAHHMGMMVEVLYAAPNEIGSRLIKPDGVPSIRTIPGPAWVCRKPYPAKNWSSGRIALYGVFLDEWLRPIRDPDQTVRSEEALFVE